VTPTIEVTVNFMAVRASPSHSKTKTTRQRVVDAKLLVA
jgi:hypothetical protein